MTIEHRTTGDSRESGGKDRAGGAGGAGGAGKPGGGASLGQRTFAATAGIALSRVSGIVRAQAVNAVFGAGPALDAYNVAMRFPTVLRDLFAEGALSAAFTKSVMQARAHSPEAERALTGLVVGVFGLVTFVIALACVALAEPLVTSVTADSFAQGDSGRLAVSCFRVLIFYLPVAMLSAVAMALLGARGLTFRATIASLFFNVGSVAGALLLAPAFAALGYDAILGLVVGTLAGGILQFLHQLVPLLRDRSFPRPTLAWKGAAGLFARHPVREIATLMLPRMLGQGALSVALFVNTHFATAAGTGAITYITNATNIILVPVGLFGVASGFASLPLLTEAATAKDELRMASLLREGTRGTLWLASFSVVSLALLSVPLCKALLEHGKVTPGDSLMNGLAVAAYALGILFNATSKVTVQGYYALGDTRQILLNSVAYLACNATLSWWLAPRLGILGLGVSSSVSAALSLVLSLAFLPRVARAKGFTLFTFAKEKRFYAELLVHAAVCAGAVAIAVLVLQPWFRSLTEREGEAFDWKDGLLLTVSGGAVLSVAFIGALVLFGPPHLRGLFGKVARRLRR